MREATCPTCGATFLRSTPAKKECDPCRAVKKRDMARAKWRSSKAADWKCVECGAPITLPDVPGNKRVPKRCPEHAAIHETARLRRKEELRRYRRHGIDETTYLGLLEAQGGVCAICGTDTPDPQGRSWHIDHDHSCCLGPYSCGKCVRGLLCEGCNQGIGKFRDDVALMHRAIAYLEGGLS